MYLNSTFISLTKSEIEFADFDRLLAKIEHVPMEHKAMRTLLVKVWGYWKYDHYYYINYNNRFSHGFKRVTTYIEVITTFNALFISLKSPDTHHRTKQPKREEGRF